MSISSFYFKFVLMFDNEHLLPHMNQHITFERQILYFLFLIVIVILL
jgi:hypothetical protein